MTALRDRLPRFSASAYLRLVLASAVYDLVLTSPFATPWSFAWVHQQLSALNQALGGLPLPVFEPFHLLIAGLLGSIVTVWSLLRLRRRDASLGRYDGMARLLFSSWMAWTLAQTGQPLLWLFLLPEAAWGIAQLWPVNRMPEQCSVAATGRSQ
ncbi:hypothetical protein RQP53_10080 [Paucibacter sp. APW11]|uniref:Uncharacterized protein n=1 Tax=Roseateles aquae TaxID=3077235 RepID=A0ABU3PAK5_9BURK|nr:hypothetical protein [Paucibacter sp. APW11]MDT8999612.1 hypothetical protein [Paucibacter sp. APW11]